MGKTYKIAVMPGDGTGPEVVAEGLKVLEAAAAKHRFALDLTHYDFGGERYLRTGEILPASAVDELSGFDAIFLGAIGHPDVKPGILEKGLLLRLRFELDQYINLRPGRASTPASRLPLKDKGPKDIDYVVVRENTGDMYAGGGGIMMKGTPHEVAMQNMLYSRAQVRPLPALGVRVHAQARQEGARHRRGQHPRPGGQDQRAHLRLRPLGPRASTRSAKRSTRTSSASTTTWTPPACGWSRARSGST